MDMRRNRRINTQTKAPGKPAGPADLPILNTKDMERCFGVTFMTIWNWRLYSNPPIPCHILESATKRKPVRFVASEILAWAKRTGRPLLENPAFLADQVARLGRRKNDPR